MNVEALLADVDQLIAEAPVVERTEWCRQAIRRMEAMQFVIRLIVKALEEEQDPT